MLIYVGTNNRQVYAEANIRRPLVSLFKYTQRPRFCKRKRRENDELRRQKKARLRSVRLQKVQYQTLCRPHLQKSILQFLRENRHRQLDGKSAKEICERSSSPHCLFSSFRTLAFVLPRTENCLTSCSKQRPKPQTPGANRKDLPPVFVRFCTHSGALSISIRIST